MFEDWFSNLVIARHSSSSVFVLSIVNDDLIRRRLFSLINEDHTPLFIICRKKTNRNAKGWSHSLKKTLRFDDRFGSLIITCKLRRAHNNYAISSWHYVCT